jgi:predicted nucleic acid-binding Zn ribbon protein
MFTTNCTGGLKASDLVYFMEVSCSQEFIFFLNNKRFKISKTMIGYIIIGADLLIVVMLFFLLQFQKWNQDKIS